MPKDNFPHPCSFPRQTSSSSFRHATCVPGTWTFPKTSSGLPNGKGEQRSQFQASLSAPQCKILTHCSVLQFLPEMLFPGCMNQEVCKSCREKNFHVIISQPGKNLLAQHCILFNRELGPLSKLKVLGACKMDHICCSLGLFLPKNRPEIKMSQRHQ